MARKELIAVGAILSGAGIYLLTRKGTTPPPPSEPPPEPEPGLANLYGNVVDEKTGALISGASIILDGNQILSDENGEYIFAELTIDTHEIVISKDGYDSIFSNITLVEGNNEFQIVLTPTDTEPPPTEQLLDLDVLSISGINGRGFASVGVDSDGVPFGVLTEPFVVSSLAGVSVNLQNKTLCFSEDDVVGLIIHMHYFGDTPGFRGTYFPPLQCANPEGCPPGTRKNCDPFTATMGVKGLFAGGSWFPGLFNGEFDWDLYDAWGNFFGGTKFRVYNMAQCTGTGSIEPA